MEIVDDNGKFKFPTVPPGDYELTAYIETATAQHPFKVEEGTLSKITLDWDQSAKPDEVVQIQPEPEPSFKTALEALRRGAMGQAVKLGRAELQNKPTAPLHATLALATYGFALEAFRFEGFRGDPMTAKNVKTALAGFLAQLDQVQSHLAEAAKDSKLTLELCIACMAAPDSHFMLGGVGALDIERDRANKPIPEGDARRRPTYRFDHGDIAWARAMIHYQQALANIALAYDWDWLDRQDAEGKQITIKLLEPARIAKAKDDHARGTVRPLPSLTAGRSRSRRARPAAPAAWHRVA